MALAEISRRFSEITSKIALSGERAVTETIRLHWLLFLAQGIAMMVLGALAVIWPQISTLAIEFYVGWMFLISGVIGLFTMFVASDAAAIVWSLLISLITSGLAIVMVRNAAADKAGPLG